MAWRSISTALFAAGAFSLFSCGGGGKKSDAGFDAGEPPFDAGSQMDSGFDAGVPDSGFDAGIADAGYDAGIEDPRCRVLPAPNVITHGGYTFNGDYTYARVTDLDPATLTDGGGFNVLDVEVFWFNNLELPKGETYKPSTKYQTCEICTLYSEDCDGLDQCDRRYLAVRGNTFVHRADADELNGRLQAVSQDLTLREWNTILDEAVPDGGCVIIRAASVDAGWGNPKDTKPDGGN